MNDRFQTRITATDPQSDQKPIYRDFRAGDIRHSRPTSLKLGVCSATNPNIRSTPGLAMGHGWYRAQINGAITTQ